MSWVNILKQPEEMGEGPEEFDLSAARRGLSVKTMGRFKDVINESLNILLRARKDPTTQKEELGRLRRILRENNIPEVK
tara:strand:- start:393 stop:629 length:237 start_codon:yes stop_codon:yes gene_type:complete